MLACGFEARYSDHCEHSLLGPIAVASQLLGILVIASQLIFRKNVITSQLFGRLYCIAINFFRELPRIAIITASQLLGTRE